MTITTPEQMRAEAATIAEDYEFLDHPKDHREIIKACVRHIAAEISDIDIVVLPATDWTACAADMLRVWDTWVSGSSEGDRDSAQRLATAASFAEQAFDHAHTNTNNIIAARAPAAMFRAFLLALIDPLHPDLDYLRADQAAGEKARAERGAVAPPVVAAPQPVAVPPIETFVMRETVVDAISYERKTVEHLAVKYADYLNAMTALTVQPADPLSDPRVVALVKALKREPTLIWIIENTTQVRIRDLAMDMLEQQRAALRAIGGEA